ncbi:MAG: 2-C-methyl-D-erythritol 4-phosphate cytidylyltransferase [Clostridia bacterium]|nr:2-C-methyl-D-erythritol 4-phosphate cytidylyltransferase [Clostridia bacterium]
MSVTTQFELEYTYLEDNVLPCAAVIVAAGNGTRMGCNKQMVPLLGIPVLVRTMLAFEKCDRIRDIVVVSKQDEIADVQKLAETYQITKLVAVVAGGEERQDSVENGLAALSSDTVYVAIHDGARPLITPQLIEAVVQDACERGAATLAVPVKNTIKQVAEGKIEKTFQRDLLYAIQTPQVFDLSIYRKALAMAKQRGLAVTDDCAICEDAGYSVYITPSSYLNFKITTPEDLIFAEALLQREEHDV